MSNKKKGLIVLSLITLCSQCLYAQTRVLGIDEMFRLADEESKSIQSYRTGRDAADEAVKAARAQRLPDVEVSLTGSYLGNGKLWDRDFSHARDVAMPHFGNNFALEAQWVVYSGGALSSGIRQAELSRQLAEMDWKKNIQEIRFLLVGNYLDLYKLDNQLQVLRRNLELTERILENMVARREQGTVLKNDITRYELQREQIRLQLVQVEDRRDIINHQLVTTLHLPEATRILPDTTLLDRRVAVLSEKGWQETATGNHIGLQQSQIAIRMKKQQVRRERSERLPHVALVAEEHLDGPITIEVPVLDNNFNYWFVGVGVKYSLSSLFKNNRKLKQARLDVTRAREQYELAQEQIEQAVQAGYTDFVTSFTELKTQENSVRLADENYSVTSNRYQNEMALLTDMLDASNMKLSADLALVNARIQVIYNYYKMKYITHTL